MAIFKDKSVWDECYIPNAVLYRKEQLDKMRYYLNPIFSSCRAYNILCIGDFGTGKTAAVHHIKKQILEEAKNTNKKIIMYYINCSSFKTAKTNVSTNRLYTMFLRDNGIDAYYTLPNEILKGMMKSYIEKHDACIIILDEVDQYIECKKHDFDKLAYAVSRELPATSLIMITNKFNMGQYLQNDVDPAVQDTFSRNLKCVAFGDYTEEELAHILLDRAKVGWEEKAYDQNTLSRIAHISFNQGWKARGVISLGKQCGEMAERDNYDRIEDWMVDNVAKSKPSRDLKQIINTLDNPKAYILRFMLKQPHMWIREDVINKWFYTKENDLKLIKGTSDSTFYHAIGKLRGMGLIDGEIVGRGRGKGTYGQLRINPANIDIIKKSLEELDEWNKQDVANKENKA